MTLTLLLLGTSLAADTFDAHGFHLATLLDTPDSALEAPTPAIAEPGALFVGGALEYARAPLVWVDGNGEVIPWLDHVVAMNLSGGWAPLRRVRLEASLPTYLMSEGQDGMSGFAFGDLRVGATASMPFQKRDTFLLGVSPFLDLPTGQTDRYLGQVGPSVGFMASARLNLGRFHLGGAAGTWHPPDVDILNMKGVDRGILDFQTSVVWNDTLATSAEIRSELPFGGNPVRATDSPTELLLYGRRLREQGGHLLGGMALPLNRGASAAEFRIFVGGGWGSVTGNKSKDLDGDGIVGDVCPEAAEDLDGWKDEDGCPEETPVTLIVDDTDGMPVPGVRWNLVCPDGDRQGGSEDEVALPAGDCSVTLVLKDRTLANRTLTVPPGPPTQVRLTVPAPRGILKVNVVDRKGAPIAGATWSARGEAQSLESRSTAAEARPGSWTVEGAAPGYRPAHGSAVVAQDAEAVVTLTLDPAQVEVKGDRIELKNSIYFDLDKATIQPASLTLLDEVAEILKAHPEIRRIRIEGHTDSQGSATHNLKLSQDRARSVRMYLESCGVDSGRMEATGFGETRPLAKGENEAAWSKNRRVDFFIVERSD